MLQWFEKRVDPYPTKDLNKPLPTTFFAFVWQATKGIRPFLFLLIACTAAAACFEALFFSYIGKLVDWLTKSQPNTFLESNQQNITILIGVCRHRLSTDDQITFRIAFNIVHFQLSM